MFKQPIWWSEFWGGLVLSHWPQVSRPLPLHFFLGFLGLKKWKSVSFCLPVSSCNPSKYMPQFILYFQRRTLIEISQMLKQEFLSICRLDNPFSYFYSSSFLFSETSTAAIGRPWIMFRSTYFVSCMHFVPISEVHSPRDCVCFLFTLRRRVDSSDYVLCRSVSRLFHRIKLKNGIRSTTIHVGHHRQKLEQFA